MNLAAATLECLPARENEGVLAFLASRSKNAPREVPSSAEDVFKGITEMLEVRLLNAIQKRTATEYDAHYEKAFPTYMGLLLVASSFARTVVPAPIIERLTSDSLCEMEADFRNQAATAFGEAMRDQSLFTVWTMRKVTDLLGHIQSKSVGDTNKIEDKKCSDQFTYHVYRANFSIDCLRISLQRDIPIYPEVLERIKDGLRSMVNAYAWVRQGFDLRAPKQDEIPVAVQWDDEDERLLAAAMQDLGDLSDENL